MLQLIFTLIPELSDSSSKADQLTLLAQESIVTKCSSNPSGSRSNLSGWPYVHFLVSTSGTPTSWLYFLPFSTTQLSTLNLFLHSVHTVSPGSSPYTYTHLEPVQASVTVRAIPSPQTLFPPFCYSPYSSKVYLSSYLFHEDFSSVFRPGFVNLGITDIHCVGGYPVHCRMFSRILLASILYMSVAHFPLW